MCHRWWVTAGLTKVLVAVLEATNAMAEQLPSSDEVASKSA